MNIERRQEDIRSELHTSMATEKKILFKNMFVMCMGQSNIVELFEAVNL